MTSGGPSLALALAFPAVLLLGCIWGGLRRRMPALLWLAPLPALAAALFAGDGALLELGNERLRLTFLLDRIWPGKQPEPDTKEEPCPSPSA